MTYLERLVSRALGTGPVVQRRRAALFAAPTIAQAAFDDGLPGVESGSLADAQISADPPARGTITGPDLRAGSLGFKPQSGSRTAVPATANAYVAGEEHELGGPADVREVTDARQGRAEVGSRGTPHDESRRDGGSAADRRGAEHNESGQPADGAFEASRSSHSDGFWESLGGIQKSSVGIREPSADHVGSEHGVHRDLAPSDAAQRPDESRSKAPRFDHPPAVRIDGEAVRPEATRGVERLRGARNDPDADAAGVFFDGDDRAREMRAVRLRPDARIASAQAAENDPTSDEARAAVRGTPRVESDMGARRSPDRSSGAVKPEDDVTINVTIGRIDVTRPAPAVPMPVARPAVRRTSVNDYLELRRTVRGR